MRYGTNRGSSRRPFVLRLFAFLGWAFLFGCGAPAGDPLPANKTPVETQSAVAEGIELRVMSFNIEWGGTKVSFDKVVEAIRAAEPDIVAVQEAEGNLERLAAALGWQHDRRNHVISRFPLIDPLVGEARYLFAEVMPGNVVAVANVHLPSDPYGEYYIRDGRSREDVVDLERRVRLPAIEPFLDVLPPLAANGMPVFLAGDFNSPSGEDWTPATIERWPYRKFDIDWPVAKAVRAAGFRDSYRESYPDPVDEPGFTWWAGRPAIPDYNPGAESWQTRIDFLWFTGPAEVTGSTLAGEVGAPGVTVPVDPWPSDHRAVVSDFTVEPAPMPVLVSADRRVSRAGEPLSITWNNRTRAGAVTVTPASGNDEVSRRIELSRQRGTAQLDPPLPPLGRYLVTLADAENVIVSEHEFWVLPADAEPTIETTKAVIAAGDPVTVRWQKAPGNRWDWIVVYPASADDPEGYFAWSHTDQRIEGEHNFTAEDATGEWPLPPGHYVAALMLDDSFRVLAKSEPFEIRAGDDD